MPEQPDHQEGCQYVAAEEHHQAEMCEALLHFEEQQEAPQSAILHRHDAHNPEPQYARSRCMRTSMSTLGRAASASRYLMLASKSPRCARAGRAGYIAATLVMSENQQIFVDLGY